MGDSGDVVFCFLVWCWGVWVSAWCGGWGAACCFVLQLCNQLFIYLILNAVEPLSLERACLQLVYSHHSPVYKDFGGGRVSRSHARRRPSREVTLAGPTSEDREQGPYAYRPAGDISHRSARRERDTDAAGHDVIKN